MMHNQKIRSPELSDVRNKGITLRSSSNVKFKEYKSNNEIYTKSLYVRGCYLWNQLPSHIQNSNTRIEFTYFLTDDLMKTLKM